MPKSPNVLQKIKEMLCGSHDLAIPAFMQQGILIEVGPGRSALGHRVGDPFFMKHDIK